MPVLSPETLMRLFNIKEEELDCGGLKLHLDKVFVLMGMGKISKESKSLPTYQEIQPNNNNEYVLGPGTYKIRYRELVKVPNNAIALALPRSTLLRMGATIYTAVWDPGYEGRGEGMMTIFNKDGIIIEHGSQIAQLIFISLDKPTSFVYRGAYYRENIY